MQPHKNTRFWFVLGLYYEGTAGVIVLLLVNVLVASYVVAAIKGRQ